jgi:hypothetical protein
MDTPTRRLPTYSGTEIWIIAGECDTLDELNQLSDFLREEMALYSFETQIQICRRLVNQHRLILASGPNQHLYP